MSAQAMSSPGRYASKSTVKARCAVKLFVGPRGLPDFLHAGHAVATADLDLGVAAGGDLLPFHALGCFGVRLAAHQQVVASCR